MNVPIQQVIPDKNQPRKYFELGKMKSLKESISAHGIVNPLIVQKEKNGEYLLIDGERRYRAAVELKMKEVPIVEVKSKDPIERMVEQFHIQEQHEGWTTGEKAQVVLDLATMTGKALKEVCDMLGINERTAQVYKSFASLHNRQMFSDLNVGIIHADKIQSIKRYAKSVKEDKLSEAFTVTEERVLEKVLIKKIADGEINSSREYSKIRDMFTSNPKTIDRLMGGEDISTLFVKSNAKAAYYLRNAVTNAGFASGNAGLFLKNPDVALTDKDAEILKRAVKILKEVLDKSGK